MTLPLSERFYAGMGEYQPSARVVRNLIPFNVAHATIQLNSPSTLSFHAIVLNENTCTRKVADACSIVFHHDIVSDPNPMRFHDRDPNVIFLDTVVRDTYIGGFPERNALALVLMVL